MSDAANPNLVTLPGVNDTGADTQPSQPGYRVQPHNIEAEQALLGAILINNDAFHQVTTFLEADHFYEPAHARIFTAAGTLINRGQLATPVTLKGYFERDEQFSHLGGAAYLTRLAAAATTVINTEFYGRHIRDLAMRRGLIRLGETMVNEAYEADVAVTASEQIETAEEKLFAMAERGTYEGGLRQFKSALTEAVDVAAKAYERDGGLSGIPTKFTKLDNLLGGLHDSDLIILAGRPAMGKSALATNIAFNAAKDMLEAARRAEAKGEVPEPASVAIFSLEMSSEQLATRILAEQADITSDKIRRGNVSDDDFSRLVRASQELHELPLFIDDTGALPIAALSARARRLKRQHGLRLIIVDYLQLVRPSSGSGDNRVQEISEITQGLKALAKELNVPVVALSQLSRQVEQRDDKRPQLSDLRESGSIEQDADVVMFVFREEYYVEKRRPREETPEHAIWLEEMEAVHGLAEIIIGKQRHGPIGTVNLAFVGRITKFDNLAEDGQIPDQAF